MEEIPSTPPYHQTRDTFNSTHFHTKLASTPLTSLPYTSPDSFHFLLTSKTSNLGSQTFLPSSLPPTTTPKKLLQNKLQKKCQKAIHKYYHLLNTNLNVSSTTYSNHTIPPTSTASSVTPSLYPMKSSPPKAHCCQIWQCTRIPHLDLPCMCLLPHLLHTISYAMGILDQPTII